MKLRWPWSEDEQEKKTYRLFCEQTAGGKGLQTLKVVSGQPKQLDDYLKCRRAGKPAEKPRWLKDSSGR